MKLLTTTAAMLLAALTLGGPASAGLFVQGIPGAACVPNNAIPTQAYKYQGRALTNTSASTWGHFIAACPVSEFAPGARALEMRAYFTGNEGQWCDGFRPAGTSFFFNYVTSGRITIGPQTWWSSGLVELTLHCVLAPGAKLERIEIVWET